MPETRKSKKTSVFDDAQRAAMKEYVREAKAAAGKGAAAQQDGEADVLAKIAEMAPADKALAEKVHALVKKAAPQLTARTWYGMPAYALNGQILCFFQPAGKFKTRYSTLGFNDKARLDDGTDGKMWPVAYAVTSLTGAEEKVVAELVRKAAG